MRSCQSSSVKAIISISPMCAHTRAQQPLFIHQCLFKMVALGLQWRHRGIGAIRAARPVLAALTMGWH